MQSRIAQDRNNPSLPTFEATKASLPEIFVISSEFKRDKKQGNTQQEILSHRQKGMLSLLLRISAGGVFLMFLLILIPDLPNPDLGILLPQLIALGIIGGCYFLNRLGLTKIGAWIFLILMQLIITFYLLSRADASILSNFRGATPLLAVTIIAGGVIIGPVYSFIFAALSLVNMLAVGFYRARPGIDSFETPLEVVYQAAVAICLFFVMAWLAWFFETNFRALIARLITQNQRLNQANQQLIEKHNLEQQFVRQVNHVTEEVSSGFAEQSREATNQISAVLRVTATIEQLDLSSAEVLTSARTVDNTAQQALEDVEKGAYRLQLGLESLGTLTVQAEKIGTALNDLFQRIQQTGQIVALVEEITESTNLLALNATIEAAGAGEYGRRFRAVANEVQNLAGRSQTALEQIHQVLDEVHQATQEATALSQQGLAEASAVMSGTQSMQDILQGIVSRVETTARLAREISVEVEQQRTTTTSITETMQYISNISSSLKRGDEHLVEKVSYLNETVAQLSTL